MSEEKQSFWAHVPLQPPDAIFGIDAAFKADPDASKVSLGVGAYRDDDGKPVVLPSVVEAERRLFEKKLNMEYGPISGTPEFVKAAQLVCFRNADVIPLVASAQSISGTGALRIMGGFLNTFWKHEKVIYVPNPTWSNHKGVFEAAGFAVKQYRYFERSKMSIDIEAFVQDVMNAPDHSIFLFHACAHNPTGADPTMEEWKRLSEACTKKKHFIIFDCAYQGFASGDLDKDSAAYRLFMADGHKVAICQSFAKNMGLYGHRVGCVHVVCSTEPEAQIVLSQLKVVIRTMYSNPPIYGARVAAEVLCNDDLREMWFQDVRNMANRIAEMRHALKTKLAEVGSTRDWSFVTSQIGMFAYTGLTPEQVEDITKNHHVYMTTDGRISLAGLNSSNIEYVARAMHTVSSK
jgi:aspartate aminotransferase